MHQSITSFVVRAVFALSLLFGFNSFAFAQSVPLSGLPQPFVVPSTTNGDGTHFTITDSQYLNVTLDSSEQIKLKMDSVPEMVTLMIEPSASSTATSTQIMLSGFVASTTYYKYEDSYHNLDQFVTDVDGKYFYTQDLSKSHIIFIQPRHSTKFIKDDATGGDCTTIGSWDNTLKVCTMNVDLYETVQIDSDGVTLDGNHHTLTGVYTGNGVFLGGRTGVTIKNLNISRANNGIYLYSSNGNTATNNTVFNNFQGIVLGSSNSNTLVSNTVVSNFNYGIELNNSSNNTLTSNTSSNNERAGIILASSSGNTLTNNATQNNGAYGVGIHASSNNNTLTSNTANNSNYGIDISVSNGNTLVSNITSNNSLGIVLNKSNDVTLSGNTVSSNYGYGMILSLSSGATVANNTILESSIYGLYLISNPEGNKIYNNNFINNATQVFGSTSEIFSLASPMGGNYWSNFDTASEGCSDANSDNICDTPYVFNGGQDNLPWTKQDGWLAPVTPARNINVAVILAEPFDVSHISTATTTQPCKLIPEKTYDDGYGEEYYNDLTYCINDYYKEVSHGSLNFTFTIFDNGGLWYKTGKTEAYYGANDLEDEFVRDAMLLASPNVDWSKFGVLSVVHAGQSHQRNETDPKTNLSTASWMLAGQPFGQQLLSLIVAEQDPMGAWAHEGGHILGIILTPQKESTPDLYLMGLSSVVHLPDGTYRDALFRGNWELMSDGAWNGPAQNRGTNPPLMSSYVQNFLGWLKEDVRPSSAYDTYWINSLETSNLGHSIFRYNLDDNTSSSTGNYYILETRNRNLSTWDESLPEDKSLVLYRVRTSGFTNKVKTISIPASPTNSTSTISANDGILSASGESFRDMEKFVEFSTTGDRSVDGKYEIETTIKKILKESFSRNYDGTVFLPENILFPLLHGDMLSVPFAPGTKSFNGSGSDMTTCLVKKRTIPLLFLVLSIVLIFVYRRKNISNIKWHKIKVARALIWVLWIASILSWANYTYYFSIIETIPNLEYNYDGRCNMTRTCDNPDPCREYRERNPYVLAPSLTGSTLPDLDLHAVTPDGKHIGMNYVTGEYENQIPDSIVSGDNQGIPEWIYVPEGTQVKYYVSAHDNDEFLKQNPELASTMATTTDSYSLYARTIDPVAGIFTSPILENQTIAPTEEKSYQIPTTGADVSLESTGNLTHYSFGGFLDPVKADGSGVYKLGRTLPIKFQLTDASHNTVSTASARLVATKVTDGVVGTNPVDLTTLVNDSGDLFRVAGDQYIYNLNTGLLATGTWQIRVVVDDWNSYSTVVSLR